MPPGGEARPHLHEGHESAIFMLEGTASMRHGPGLEHVDVVKEGDFVYIPAGSLISRSIRRTGSPGR